MAGLSTDRSEEEALISADSHVIELPDLWETRLSQPFRDRAPKVYFDERRESWMFGSADVPPQAVGGLFMAGQRPEEISNFRKAGFSVARSGGWDPVQRLTDMQVDGVSGEVLCPSHGLGLFCVEDAAFQEACFRVYNDWIIDYCKSAPEKLFGIALISVYDVGEAVSETRTLQERGTSRSHDLAGPA